MQSVQKIQLYQIVYIYSMKYVITLLLLMQQYLLFSQQAAERITGQWLNEEKDAKIEIYQSGTLFFGKLIWGKNLILKDGRLRKDEKNPDAGLKERTLLHTVILKDLEYNGKEWTGGTIYDPKSGNTYSCTLKLNGDILHLRGYKGFTLLGRTTTWARAD